MNLSKSCLKLYMTNTAVVILGFADYCLQLWSINALFSLVMKLVGISNECGWQGGVCLAFADEVLCWLYGTVKESEFLIFVILFPFSPINRKKKYKDSIILYWNLFCLLRKSGHGDPREDEKNTCFLK